MADKYNVAEESLGLAFEMGKNDPVFEPEPLAITPAAILGKPSNIESPKLDDAVEWLKEILGKVDSMSSKIIFELAKKEGINYKTLKRAKKESGIQSTPVYEKGILKTWLWRLSKE